MAEPGILKDAQSIWDSFATFRETRQHWMNVIDAPRAWATGRRLYTIDLGKAYHDFGDRHYDPQPAWELTQIVSKLRDTPFRASVKSRTGKNNQPAQDFESFLNRLFFLMDPLTLPALIGHLAGLGVGIAREEITTPLWPELKKGGKLYSANGMKAEEYADSRRDYKLSLAPPFSLTWVSPLACAWEEDNQGVAVFVHQGERPMSRVAETYGDAAEFLKAGKTTWEGETKPGMRRMVKIWEVATRDKCWHYAQAPDGRTKELLREYANPFGRVPYRIFPGNLRAGGDPDSMYIPLIEAALSLAPQKSLLRTLRLLAARLTGAPVYDVVIEESGEQYLDDKGNLITWYIEPLNPFEIPLPSGCRLQRRDIQAGVDLDKAQRDLDALSEKYGPRAAFTGDIPQGRIPAYEYAVAGDAAQVMLVPAVDSIKQGLKEFSVDVGYAIKHHIKEPVPLLVIGKDKEQREIEKMVEVRPEDIGEFDISIKGAPKSLTLQVTESEAVRRWTEGTAEAGGAAVFDLRYVYEEVWGGDDWEMQERRILLQRFEQRLLPYIEAALLQTVMQNQVNKGRVAPEIAQSILAQAASQGLPVGAPQMTAPQEPASAFRAPGVGAGVVPELPSGARIG